MHDCEHHGSVLSPPAGRLLQVWVGQLGGARRGPPPLTLRSRRNTRDSRHSSTSLFVKVFLLCDPVSSRCGLCPEPPSPKPHGVTAGASQRCLDLECVTLGSTDGATLASRALGSKLPALRSLDEIQGTEELWLSCAASDLTSFGLRDASAGCRPSLEPAHCGLKLPQPMSQGSLCSLNVWVCGFCLSDEKSN